MCVCVRVCVCVCVCARATREQTRRLTELIDTYQASAAARNARLEVYLHI